MKGYVRQASAGTRRHHPDGRLGIAGFRAVSSAGATSDAAPVFLPDTKTSVGAGLLAKTVCQSTFVRLIHRIREQARSHINSAAITGSSGDVGGAARHPCESAQVAAEARSSRARLQRHGASFEFSLSWLPPLRVMRVGESFTAFSYSDSSPKSYVMLERNHNELLLN